MGGANELLGVLLIASPELLPRVAAAAVVIQRRSIPLARGLVRQICRLLRLPRSVSAHIEAVAELGAAGALTARLVRRPPENADVDELVQWLVREHARHDDQIHSDSAR